MPCHGKGDLARDGCCYLPGVGPCPLRLDAAGVTQFVADNNLKGQKARRAEEVAQGVTDAGGYVCAAAADVLVNNPNLVTDGVGFEAAWLAHPRYVAEVAPVWRAQEAANGHAVGSYDCPTWQGGCCFAEDAATNTAGFVGLHPEQVTLRQR